MVRTFAPQGKSHGQRLQEHAVNQAPSVRQTLGVRVLIANAKDSRATAFYASYGFRSVSGEALSLYQPISGRRGADSGAIFELDPLPSDPSDSSHPHD